MAIQIGPGIFIGGGVGIATGAIESIPGTQIISEDLLLTYIVLEEDGSTYIITEE